MMSLQDIIADGYNQVDDDKDYVLSTRGKRCLVFEGNAYTKN